MGIFDAIKSGLSSVKGFVGEAATVTVKFDGTTFSNNVKGKVISVAKSNDFDINSVSIELFCSEEISVDGKETQDKNPLKLSSQIYTTKVNLAGAQKITANSTNEWDFDIALPSDKLPTFRGKYAKIVWYVVARLDKSGNDPDSGEVNFEVK
jgi:hypothetical protein